MTTDWCAILQLEDFKANPYIRFSITGLVYLHPQSSLLYLTQLACIFQRERFNLPFPICKFEQRSTMQPNEPSIPFLEPKFPRRYAVKTQPWREILSIERLDLITKTQTEEYQGEGAIRTRLEITSKK